MIVKYLTIGLLWLASISYWSIAVFNSLDDRHQSTAILEQKLINLVSTKAQPKAIQPSDKNPLLGLFGKVELELKPKATATSTKVVNFGPTSLQGLFTDDSKVWAIVKGKNNQSSIIQPDQIISFNSSSITIKTRSGIKSLHLKQDKKGINIREIHHSKSGNKDVPLEKRELSRAEKLRIKLLEAARRKSN